MDHSFHRHGIEDFMHEALFFKGTIQKAVSCYLCYCDGLTERVPPFNQ